MKKLVLFALAAVMMAGCENKDVKTICNINGWDIGITEIDSCEYLFARYRLTHKGNCRFCKERRQKEMKELVEQLKDK